METGIKMELPLFKNNSSRGFSILGLLITASLMSGVALVAMQMTKTQIESSTFTAAKLDEGEIKRQITLVLQDSIACKITFDSKTIGSDFNAISNAKNIPIFSIGAVADTKITITSLKTKDLNVFTPALRDVDLIVGVSKVVAGKEIKSNFNIPLKVKATGPAAPITDCFSDTSGIILAASVQSCTSLGGSWDAVTSTCALNNKIRKSGDTMTDGLVISSGSLAVNSGTLYVSSGSPITTNSNLQINNAKKICIGTSCQDFSAKSCPVNEVAIGIKADGDLNCQALPTSTASHLNNCQGNWGSCSKTCDSGIQTYTVTSPATNGGGACSFANGTTRSCNTHACQIAVDCVGSWSSCKKNCSQFNLLNLPNTGDAWYTITTPASNGGKSCNNGGGRNYKRCDAGPCADCPATSEFGCSIPAARNNQHRRCDLPKTKFTIKCQNIAPFQCSNNAPHSGVNGSRFNSTQHCNNFCDLMDARCVDGKWETN